MRYYRWVFARDYRETPWREEETELTFLYRSAPGEGLEVRITSGEGGDPADEKGSLSGKNGGGEC